MVETYQNLLSEKELLLLDSLCKNFIETEVPYKNNNYFRQSLNINDELLEYQKQCLQYLSDEYELYALWLNKITNETNIDNDFHIDKADLSIITYLNEDFQGGEFEYIFKNEQIKFLPKINHTILFNEKIKHRVLNVISGTRFSLISFYRQIQKNKKTLI